MIPVTYPSSVSTSKESQMVVFALSSVAGLQRWTDYIPVKFQATGTANSFNTDGYLACDFLTSSSGRQAWVDYIPVFVDVNATDAWQVSANGFIPFNTLAGGGLGSSLDFNFVATGTLDPLITFTRASTATFFNSAGVLQSAANDTPRFDYNPATLAAQGLLIEEARTNSIRNNTMQGAVAGTPGTLPTNWTMAAGGLTFNVIGTGTESGINYVDIQLVGTTGATSAGIRFEPTNFIAASSGQTWTGSFYVRQVAGALTNITSVRANIFGRTSANASNADSFQSASFSASLSATNIANNRQVVSGTLADATTAFIGVQLALGFASGVAIDITLRIGLPQLERGAFATSVIPTVNAFALGVTREADVASVNTLSPWYNATEGTLFAEWIAQAFTHRPATFNDGTQNNAIALVGTATNIGSNVFVSNVFQGTVTVSGTFTTGTTYKQATAYKLNDTQDFANGVAATTDTTISIPTVTQLLLGAGRGGMASTPGNGWLRRLTYYPRRLSQAEGQAITA